MDWQPPLQERREDQLSSRSSPNRGVIDRWGRGSDDSGTVVSVQFVNGPKITAVQPQPRRGAPSPRLRDVSTWLEEYKQGAKRGHLHLGVKGSTVCGLSALKDHHGAVQQETEALSHMQSINASGMLGFLGSQRREDKMLFFKKKLLGNH